MAADSAVDSVEDSAAGRPEAISVEAISAAAAQDLVSKPLFQENNM